MHLSNTLVRARSHFLTLRARAASDGSSLSFPTVCRLTFFYSQDVAVRCLTHERCRALELLVLTPALLFLLQTQKYRQSKVGLEGVRTSLLGCSPPDLTFLPQSREISFRSPSFSETRLTGAELGRECLLNLRRWTVTSRRPEKARNKGSTGPKRLSDRKESTFGRALFRVFARDDEPMRVT